MGKIAQYLVALLGLTATIAHGVDAHPGIDQGDGVARGHRAMALLGALAFSLGILLVAAFLDLFVRPFLDQTLLWCLLALAGLSFFAIYVPLDRRITRRERERTDAASKTSTES